LKWSEAETKGAFTRNTNFVSYNRTLCRGTDFLRVMKTDLYGCIARRW
jgi:hypothetical protein